MPTYRYSCADHGQWEEWASITVDSTRATCQTCGVSCPKVFTPPNISADATPTSHAETAATNARERLWDRTMPAYKRLRANGVNPPSIDSSPELEARAETRLEVEMGQIIPIDRQRAAVGASEDLTGVPIAEKVT